MRGGEHHLPDEQDQRHNLEARSEHLARVETVERWPDVNELGRLACLSCAREQLRAYWPGPREERPSFSRPEDLVGVVTPLLAGRDREHGVLLALDTRYRLIEVEEVSVGSADNTFLAPREVYRDALLHGATAIAVAHNHPSGDPEPSAADVGITERLAQAGITLGVELIDHLVIGGEGEWRSLAREGLV